MLKSIISARRWLALAFLATVALLAALALVSPQQIPVVGYKLALALLAGLAGYWLDRVIWPYAAPSSYLCDDWRNDPDADNAYDADYPIVIPYKQIFVAAMFRQALIVCACVMGVCLGL